MTDELAPHTPSPFEQIRRTNDAGNEYWSSRDFARVLGYVNYRHFLAVIEKARIACFNSGQRLDDHFVGIDDMIMVGKGARRPVKTVLLSRYACYLVIHPCQKHPSTNTASFSLGKIKSGLPTIFDPRRQPLMSFAR